MAKYEYIGLDRKFYCTCYLDLSLLKPFSNHPPKLLKNFMTNVLQQLRSDRMWNGENSVKKVLIKQYFIKCYVDQTTKDGMVYMYVVGSKSFRPDIQKPRQMENAVRDI